MGYFRILRGIVIDSALNFTFGNCYVNPRGFKRSIYSALLKFVCFTTHQQYSKIIYSFKAILRWCFGQSKVHRSTKPHQKWPIKWKLLLGDFNLDFSRKHDINYAYNNLFDEFDN